jgi:hypothetical protein
VEALLIPVLADVVAPLHLTGGLVDSVEGAGTGTDEHYIPHDRGGRENSTAGFIFPAKFWSSRRGNVCLFLNSGLRTAQGRHRHQNERCNETPVLFHSGLAADFSDRLIVGLQTNHDHEKSAGSKATALLRVDVDSDDT